MKNKVRRANRVHIRAAERVELARKRQGCEYLQSEIPVEIYIISKAHAVKYDGVFSCVVEPTLLNPLALNAVYEQRT